MTLYNNYDINYTEWFEEFKDYCEDNGIDHTQYDEDSEFFHNWVNDTLSMEWDDLIYNIRHNDTIDCPCLVVGTLGLWHGKVDINPRRFEKLEDAINTCINGCEYIVIEDNDGVVSISGTHHDGTNRFTIYKLNEQGLEVDLDYDEFIIEKHTEKFSNIF